MKFKNKKFGIWQITLLFLILIALIFSALFTVEYRITSFENKNSRMNEAYSLCVKTADKAFFETEESTNRARAFILGSGADNFNYFIKGKTIGNEHAESVESLKAKGIDSSVIDFLKESYYLIEIQNKAEMNSMALACKSGIYNKISVPEQLFNYPLDKKYRNLSEKEMKDTAYSVLFGNEYINLKGEIAKSINNCTNHADSFYHNEIGKNHSIILSLNIVKAVLYLLLISAIIGFALLILKEIRKKAYKENENLLFNGQKQHSIKAEEKSSHKLPSKEEELLANMKKTGIYISVYDILNKKLELHKELSKRYNIKSLYENMPNDFLESVFPLLDKNSKEKFKNFFKQILSGEESGFIEIPVHTSKDSPYWQRCSFKTMFNKNEEPVKAVITISDIKPFNRNQELYSDYINSIENRVIQNKGAFVLIDVTESRLLKVNKSESIKYYKEPAKNLNELLKKFDEINLTNGKNKDFKDLLNKENLIHQFEIGNQDILSHWKCTGLNGLKSDIEIMTVLIKNPYTENIEAAIQIYTKAKFNALDKLSTRKILFIQSKSAQRDYLIESLTQYFIIFVANSCKEATNILNKITDFEMIILNVEENDESAFDFIAEQKAKFNIIPLLVLTDGNISTQVKALKLGVSDIQTKPVNTTVLKHRINNLFAKNDAINAVYNSIDSRDEITGLLNRRSFIALSNEILKNSSETDTFVMMCMDIVAFKLINSRFGNQKGDEVLKKIGETIFHSIEGTIGIAMRAIADRFYILIPNDKALIDKICNSVKSLKYNIPINVVIKISIYQSQTQETVENMLTKVLLANDYLQMQKGKTIARYNNSMLEPVILKQKLIEDFPKALEKGDILPYLQPKYDYANKCFIGAEALARWIHPTLGFLSPDKFIPIFESEGLITKLDLYILECICKIQRKRKEKGLPTLCISVNLSPIDFKSTNLADTVLDIVENYRLDYNDIRFEITETSYINDSDLLIDFINQVHEKGFLIDMDDFGSGYSSLNMLDEINVDALKLDMRMTQNKNNKGEHILGAIIRMAGWLKIDVIAEGIESEEQAEFLYSLGCRYMQGYHFSKPVPVEEFEKLLTEQSDKSMLVTKSAKLIQQDKLPLDSAICTPESVPLFIQTISSVFSFVVANNYSKNKYYYIMEYNSSPITDLNSEGKYDDLFKEYSNAFDKDGKKSFTEIFNRKNIINSLKNNKHYFTHIGRQLNADGEYQFVRTAAVAYRDTDGDIKGYTLARNIENDFAVSKISNNYKKVIDGMSKAFLCVYEIDLVSGELKKIYSKLNNNKENKKIKDFKSEFDKWAKSDMSESDFKKHRNFWDFSNLTERIDKNKDTSMTFLTKSTGWRTVSLVELERNSDGKVTKVLWLSQNVDESKKKEQDAEEVMEAFAETYDIAYHIDIGKKLCYELKSNNKVSEFISPVGYIDDVIGKFIDNCVDSKYREKMSEFTDFSTLNERLKNKKIISVEYKGKFSPWLRANIIPISYDLNGNIKQLVFGISLIYKEKLAEIDGITGLLNSATAQKKIKEYILNGNSNGFVLLIIDIDNLKMINDTYGHQAGTDVICGIADIIKSHFSSDDILGRYGGDEFILFVKNSEDNKEKFNAKLSNLLFQIASKQFIKNNDLKVTCTIGCADMTDRTKTFKEIFERADYALYNAKKHDKNTFKYYEE